MVKELKRMILLLRGVVVIKKGLRRNFQKMMKMLNL
jgi:hypothetical protein